MANLPRARKLMREAGVDALIASSPENVAYLADYYCLSHWNNKGTPVFVILPSDESNEPVLITLALEYTSVAEHPSWVTDVRLHGTSFAQIGIERRDAALEAEDDDIARHVFADQRHPNWLDVAKAALADRGLLAARLGLDESGVSYSQRQQLVANLPKASIVDAADLLRRIRMVKTQEEIARLRRSNEITESALSEMTQQIKEGANERDLVHYYNSRVASLGGIPTLTLITGGRRSGHPHALTGDYWLRPGDVVKIDLGCTYRLYWSDTARTKVVGEPSAEVIRAYTATLAGERAAVGAVRAGVRPSELFDLAVGTIRDSGLPDYTRHHVGHGIGIEIYDHPLVQPADATSEISGLGGLDSPLEPGMVLNIECPYYMIGGFGMNVEDTVVVAEDGAEPLTHLERDLHL